MIALLKTNLEKISAANTCASHLIVAQNAPLSISDATPVRIFAFLHRGSPGHHANWHGSARELHSISELSAIRLIPDL